MNKYSGFTIIELLITLALVSILMTFGIPYFGDIIKNDRLSTQINTLVGHLALARSEAVLRNLQVGLCASSSTTSCMGTSWKAGWIVFVDVNNDTNLDAGEEILRVNQTLSGSNTLTSTLGNRFFYDNRGFSASGTVSFSLCDDRGVSKMKSISISNTGRVRQGGGAAC